MQAYLSVQSVSKAYGSQPILRDISLDVGSGEFVALVGPSGCGKSTLLRVIAGLESADSGKISLAHQDVAHLRAADRDVAMVFQSYALYPHLTARQNMAVPLVMRRLTLLQRWPIIGKWLPGRTATLRAIHARIDAIAESLKITALLGRKPAAMSGGQRQRVALGRAIVREPKAFLMDEPLSNLDAALRVHTRAEIVELHRELGATTIYVTHDQEEALSMADRVAVMKDGQILQIAPPRVVYDDPDHLDVATFIGSPRINVVDAKVDEHGRGYIGLRPFMSGLDAWKGQALKIAFRPEHAIIQAAPQRLDPSASSLPFDLMRLEFLGAEAIAHGEIVSGESVLVRLSAQHTQRLPKGDLILNIDPKYLLVFCPKGERIRSQAPVIAEVAHA